MDFDAELRARYAGTVTILDGIAVVDGYRHPDAVEVLNEDRVRPGLLMRRRGFKLVARKEAWALSVVWGGASYSSNYDYIGDGEDETWHSAATCAELAIVLWHYDERPAVMRWHVVGEPQGFVSAHEVLGVYALLVEDPVVTLDRWNDLQLERGQNPWDT